MIIEFWQKKIHSCFSSLSRSDSPLCGGRPYYSSFDVFPGKLKSFVTID